MKKRNPPIVAYLFYDSFSFFTYYFDLSRRFYFKVNWKNLLL